MATPHAALVVVIGAGPIGLVAAAHLAQRNLPFLLLEAGTAIASSVRRWAHVRMFSPWRYNLDPVAVRLLEATGWVEPDPDTYPTGGELIERFLEPLASHPVIVPSIRPEHRVVAVARYGRDKLAGVGRAGHPFLVQVATPHGERTLLARAILDASGGIPNPLGAAGVPALGEAELRDVIAYGMPDVLGQERSVYAGKRILVIGAGHSAFGVLLDLVELAQQAPGTTIHWAIRRRSLTGRLGSLDDKLPERGRLGQRIAATLASGAITLTAVSRSSASNGARTAWWYGAVPALSRRSTASSVPPVTDPTSHRCGSSASPSIQSSKRRFGSPPY